MTLYYNDIYGLDECQALPQPIIFQYNLNELPYTISHNHYMTLKYNDIYGLDERQEHPEAIVFNISMT